MNVTLFSALFGGEARFKALRYLSEHPGESFGLLELATAAGTESGNLHRILNAWAKAGLIKVTGKARHWRYQLSPDPALSPLGALFRHNSKVVDDLTALFAEIPEIETALIFGSFARGRETALSDIDVMVLGDVSELRLNARLKPISRDIGRPINASVYSADQIRTLAESQDPVLDNILQNDVIMLKGQIDDIRQIADPTRAAGEY